MIVRLHYADGSVEDHPLENGVHFADYIRVVDVPGSKLAFKLRGQQIRYFAVHPKKKDTIERIELVKGPDETAPDRHGRDGRRRGRGRQVVSRASGPSAGKVSTEAHCTGLHSSATFRRVAIPYLPVWE